MHSTKRKTEKCWSEWLNQIKNDKFQAKATLQFNGNVWLKCDFCVLPQHSSFGVDSANNTSRLKLFLFSCWFCFVWFDSFILLVLCSNGIQLSVNNAIARWRFILSCWENWKRKCAKQKPLLRINCDLMFYLQHTTFGTFVSILVRFKPLMIVNFWHTKCHK